MPLLSAVFNAATNSASTREEMKAHYDWLSHKRNMKAPRKFTARGGRWRWSLQPILRKQAKDEVGVLLVAAFGAAASPFGLDVDTAETLRSVAERLQALWSTDSLDLMKLLEVGTWLVLSDSSMYIYIVV